MGKQGRPVKIQGDQEAILAQIVKSNPTATLDEVGAELTRRTGLFVHAQTLVSTLRRLGLERVSGGDAVVVESAASTSASAARPWSMPAATWYAPDAPGGCCPRTFHAGRTSTGPFSAGAHKASSSRGITACGGNGANGRQGRSSRRQGSRCPIDARLPTGGATRVTTPGRRSRGASVLWWSTGMDAHAIGPAARSPAHAQLLHG